METPQEIRYSDGRVVKSPVVQVWEDLHNERSGFFRAFWCADKDASSGSPVIGYCSAGGSQRTIIGAAQEVWKLYPNAQIFQNGKEVKK